MATLPNSTLKVAVVGTGFISEYHINGLKTVGDADVVALVGRNAEKTKMRAAEFGIGRAETDYSGILQDSSIDAIVIATPDNTHHAMTIAALETGKAVLLQKPMALTSAECRDLLAAQKRTDGSLTVSFMHRYFAEVQWLKELLDKGVLGALYNIRIRNATPGADWADWFFQPGNVAGGVAMQLGVHGIDLIQYLLGPITAVSARVSTLCPNRRLKDGRLVSNPLEDNVLAHYETARGAMVSHEMSYTEAAGCDRFRLEVYGEKGTVWLRSERGKAAIYLTDDEGHGEWTTPQLGDPPFGQEHHAHWVSMALGKIPADDTGIAGLSSIEIVEAIYHSAASNCLTPISSQSERIR